MRRLLKWLWIPAVLLVLSAVIGVLISWQPREDEEDDWTGMEHVYYFDSSVSEEDDRLQNSFVNNSGTNFFVKGAQLQNQLSLEENTAPLYSLSFVDFYRRRSHQSDTGVTSAGRWLYVERECAETTDGTSPTGMTYRVGETLSYFDLCRIDGRLYYRLGAERFIPAECVQRLCRKTSLDGTLWHPYTVDVDRTQYLSFAAAGESLHLYFSTDNEFISLFLAGLPEGSSWELYDRTYRKIGGNYTGTGESAEIYYRASSAGRFLLKITASDACEVQMTFHRDQNEWQKNMVKTALNDTYTGVFDYYGDEDFFLIGRDVRENLEEVALLLDGVDADLQIMAYDEFKNLIGRYVRKKGISEEIVLYGLEDVYALSVRTLDGSKTSAEYKLQFFYNDVSLLGLETFGFKISSPVEVGEDGENYYTAVCNGLLGKRITDVQTTARSKVTMTLTSEAGITYSFKEGEDIPLRAGKNTVKIHIENPSDSRTLTLCITDRNSYQLGHAFVLQNGTPMYSQALTSSSRVSSLAKGTKVLAAGGEQNDMIKVELTDGSGQSGWVQRYMLFDDYKRCEMPDSYAPAIRKLQKQHPNWKFTFVSVGKTLDAAVATESTQRPIITTSSWRTPSREEIKYYMDPHNFLNEQDIFMFEKQTYHEGTYSEKGVAAVWNEVDGALASEDYYVDCFMEAGKIAGLSPYFIAARASIESGNGTSKLARGVSPGYEGYYNFFGINAVDSNPRQGAVFAKEHGWSTQRISIVEGAVWIKSQYISVLQYTPYFIKYSFVPERGWHQYMTDVTAPLSDARGCYKAHAAGGTLDSAIEFVIPVFD